MPGPDLRSFVSRSTALVDSEPPTTGRETRAWLVEPFLEALGWTVHADATAVDTTVEDTRLEYVLSIESVPALFVAVEPYGDSLEQSRATALLEAMAWTGVDRAIYTNGREYALFAGTTSADRLACGLPSLTDHESAIEHFSRAELQQRLETSSPDAIARQLAVGRQSLVESFVDQLTSVADDSAAGAFEAAADRFLGRLIVSYAENEPDRFESASEDVSLQFNDPTASTRTAGEGAGEDDGASNPDSEPREARSESAATDGSPCTRPRERSGQPGDAAESDAGPAPDAQSGAGQVDEASVGADSSASTDSAPDSRSDRDSSPEPNPGLEDADADTDAADGSTGTDPAGGRNTSDGRDSSDETAAAPADESESDGDGEYVARFFNDRGSIGAIGHSRSDQALVGVAEYLFERGLSGIRIPWSPGDDDDDAPTVLNDEPVRADGTRMTAPKQLSNGLYLETAGDVEIHAKLAEALAARAGLRVMLTGDWESQRE